VPGKNMCRSREAPDREKPVRIRTVISLLTIGGLAAIVWTRVWAGRQRRGPGRFPIAADGPHLLRSMSRETEPKGSSAGVVASSSTGKLPRFLTVIIALGALALLVLLTDLVVRGFKREVEPPVWETSQRETEPGRQAIVRHGCGGCHVIPGIRQATGRVGPQLNGFRDQMYIAGVLPNMPENLVAWIQNPQQFNPRTAMPNLHVTAEEAREIAIYIYAQP
jgi:cytochrome c